MNKSILLVLIPCLLAVALSQYAGNAPQSGYAAYQRQNALYNAGNVATAQVQNARILNYLFGFLLLLDLTNATGNSLKTLG